MKYVGHPNEELNFSILQAMLKGFVSVTEKQPEDFLPGGKYGDCASDAARINVTLQNL